MTSKPIRGGLTVETIAKCVLSWVRKGFWLDMPMPERVKQAVSYYRDYYELSPYRVRQLRKLVAEG